MRSRRVLVLNKCGGKAVRAAVPHGRPRASRSGAADKHTSRRNCAGKSGIHSCLFHASNERSQRRMPSACPPCRDRLSGGSVKLSAPNAAGAAPVLSSVGQVLLITAPTKAAPTEAAVPLTRLCRPLCPSRAAFSFFCCHCRCCQRRCPKHSKHPFQLRRSAVAQTWGTLFIQQEPMFPDSPIDLSTRTWGTLSLKFSRERALFALI